MNPTILEMELFALYLICAPICYQWSARYLASQQKQLD